MYNCIFMNCKDSASREENKISSLIFYPEAPPILLKVTIKRAQHKINSVIFYPEAPPILLKDSASYLFFLFL